MPYNYKKQNGELMSVMSQGEVIYINCETPSIAMT